MENGRFPVPNDPAIRQAMMNELFIHVDKDKDGVMSPEEFKILLRLQNSLGKRQKQKQEL